ncbi:MAG: NUDIX domain-containing protein [Propionicimonas sp.]
MTEPAFRTRRFVPVPPLDRPRRSRDAARVLITDGESVLLFADTDPGIPGSRWWVTPGGGIDPGETPAQAAVREIAEETGLHITESDLAGPIGRRTVIHGYSDQILCQSEWFFVLHTPVFEVDIAGHTADEQVTLDGHAWLPIAGLPAMPDPVWPVTLSALLDLAGASWLWPRELGTQEESTLPVGLPGAIRC